MPVSRKRRFSGRRRNGGLALNVLVVFDHPRRSSFCGAVLDSLIAGLAAAGHRADVADLRAEGFDPRLPPADEPDWNDADKVYRDAVLAEQARMMRNDVLAFVFPVWWWSLPATTKGWIDRVWNNGWAYGARTRKHKKALLLGTAAGSAASYEKRGYDQAMRIQIVTGMMEKRGAGTSRGRENWGSPISASSAWRLERRRGRSELPFAWPPAGHGRQATSSPDILQEDGVGIFRNLPERELRRLKILLDHGSDPRQRRDGPLMFGLGFGIGTGVIVDRVDQVLYLGGTTKAKRPQLLQIVSQIEPRQRLVHTVDH